MSDLETSVARLRELQVEAETALDVARKAFAQVERAVAKIDNQIESLERSGVKRERGAFASPLQGMAYIAIWLACEGKVDHAAARSHQTPARRGAQSAHQQHAASARPIRPRIRVRLEPHAQPAHSA